ncbi:Sperm-associated antigen 6 [Gonapodya sp. JEL0774]|nr:Sperm-associated antigen 6 [Gonapodya sp. JEL0774]
MSGASNAKTIATVLDRFRRERLAFVQSIAELSLREENADVLCSSGAVRLLKPLLDDDVPQVQQAAILSLGRLADHSETAARMMVAEGIAGTLRYLKRLSLLAIRHITLHAAQLAQAIADANAFPSFVSCLGDPDPQVKEAAAWAVAAVGNLAEAVADAGALEGAVKCAGDPEEVVRKRAVEVIQGVVKHSAELSQLAVNLGALAPLVDHVTRGKGVAKLPGVLALSHIASSSETLALAAITSLACPPLVECLDAGATEDPRVVGAAAWCLAQMGRHSTEHARMVGVAGGVGKMAEVVARWDGKDGSIGTEALAKVKSALLLLLSKTLHLPSILPLVLPSKNIRTGPPISALSTPGTQSIYPPSILGPVYHQLAKILLKDPAARREVASSGALEAAQSLLCSIAESTQDPIVPTTFNTEKEIVRYFTPGYEGQILSKLDDTRGLAAASAAMERREKLAAASSLPALSSPFSLTALSPRSTDMSWDDEDFEVPSAKAPSVLPKKKSKWDDEEEDESAAADDWEQLAEEKPAAPKPSESKPSVTKPPAPAPSKKKAPKTKYEKFDLASAAGAEDKGDEEDELASLTPSDRKQRERELQEQADFKNTQDLFAGLPKPVEAKANGATAGGFAFGGANPKTKEEFNKLGKELVAELNKFEKSTHYPSFVESLVRDLCSSLEEPADLRKIQGHITQYLNERVKQKQAPAKKKGPLKKLNAGDADMYADIRNTPAAGPGAGRDDIYDDFM